MTTSVLAHAHLSAENAGLTKIHAHKVNVFYGEKQALFDVSLDISQKAVTSFIGPSGCGKSTFLRCINRMNDTISICKVSGTIEIDGQDVNARNIDPVVLRARVGMVFQKPNPFPKSIYENVAYGPRIHGLATGKDELDAIVESSLRRAPPRPAASIPSSTRPAAIIPAEFTQLWATDSHALQGVCACAPACRPLLITTSAC